MRDRTKLGWYQQAVLGALMTGVLLSSAIVSAEEATPQTAVEVQQAEQQTKMEQLQQEAEQARQDAMKAHMEAEQSRQQVEAAKLEAEQAKPEVAATENSATAGALTKLYARPQDIGIATAFNEAG